MDQKTYMKNQLTSQKRFTLRSIATKGFTLIELMIVMAVIAILAGIVLVGIDPVEQTRRGTDTSTLSIVDEIEGGMNRYYVGKGGGSGAYVAEDANFLTNLAAAGELKSATIVPNGGSTCGAGRVAASGYCYDLDASTGQFVIYAKGLSKRSQNKPAAPCANTGPGTTETWVVYGSNAGKTGVTCAEPIFSLAQGSVY